MSLASYSDLQTAVPEWLARVGDTALTARIPDFVYMAEQRIAYGSESVGQVPKIEPLRIAAMETSFSIATIAGTETIALPSGYLSMRSIYVDGSPVAPINYVTPNQREDIWMQITSQGKPKIYTILGNNIVFSPTPDAIYTVKGWYYQKFAALVTSSTNWLMTNAPGVYLYATLLEAALYNNDDSGAMRFGAQYISMINALQSQDEQDRHSGATLTMMSDTGNP